MSPGMRPPVQSVRRRSSDREKMVLMASQSIRALVAAVLAGAAVLVVGTSARAAAPSIALGQTGFGSIVVDDAHGHVLVSGPAANEVLVFDLAGNLVKTIPNQYGAGAMVVHGSTLYVVNE